MVKKGDRLLVPMPYTDTVTGRQRYKKFSWVCERCGTPYVYREDAIACEKSHGE